MKIFKDTWHEGLPAYLFIFSSPNPNEEIQAYLSPGDGSGWNIINIEKREVMTDEEIIKELMDYARVETGHASSTVLSSLLDLLVVTGVTKKTLKELLGVYGMHRELTNKEIKSLIKQIDDC